MADTMSGYINPFGVWSNNWTVEEIHAGKKGTEIIGLLVGLVLKRELFEVTIDQISRFKEMF